MIGDINVKHNAMFNAVVEKYLDKVYNFYYKIVKNDDICIELVLKCFHNVDTFLKDNIYIEKCDLYRIAVKTLKDSSSDFIGKTVYYDFYMQYGMQNEMEKELNVKLNNVDFCFFKLEFNEKIILCLKYLIKLKNWEIAYVVCEREKAVSDIIEAATTNFLKSMIDS